MKIRNGFVSNSSSSSYIVVIPDGFKPKKENQITKILWDILLRKGELNRDCMFHDIEPESDDETDAIYDTFDNLTEELKPYCLAEIETGADNGSSIILLDNKKIKKLWGKK